ncbi:Haloacid dehalogenase-like hydrolase domain protein, partial [mine drainage metagenome]
SAQRRLSLAHALRACGADEAQAEPAFEAFFSARNRVVFYDDALPALTRLAALLPLASLSNGNADLARIGIDAHFAVQVSAREAGVAKPDARIFAALCQRLLRARAGVARGRRSVAGCRRRARCRAAGGLAQPYGQ